MSEYSDIAGSDDIIIVNCDTQETFNENSYRTKKTNTNEDQTKENQKPNEKAANDDDNDVQVMQTDAQAVECESAPLEQATASLTDAQHSLITTNPFDNQPPVAQSTLTDDNTISVAKDSLPIESQTQSITNAKSDSNGVGLDTSTTANNLRLYISPSTSLLDTTNVDEAQHTNGNISTTEIQNIEKPKDEPMDTTDAQVSLGSDGIIESHLNHTNVEESTTKTRSPTINKTSISPGPKTLYSFSQSTTDKFEKMLAKVISPSRQSTTANSEKSDPNITIQEEEELVIKESITKSIRRYTVKTDLKGRTIARDLLDERIIEENITTRIEALPSAEKKPVIRRSVSKQQPVKSTEPAQKKPIKRRTKSLKPTTTTTNTTTPSSKRTKVVQSDKGESSGDDDSDNDIQEIIRNDDGDEDDDMPTDNLSGEEFVPPVKSSDQPIKKGLRVFAKWIDGHFYPGIIGNVSGEKYSIEFDDGAKRYVKHQEIILKDYLEPNQNVMAQKQNGDFEKAIIKRLIKKTKSNNLGYVVEIDDKEKWYPLRLISLTLDQTENLPFMAKNTTEEELSLPQRKRKRTSNVTQTPNKKTKNTTATVSPNKSQRTTFTPTRQTKLFNSMYFLLTGFNDLMDVRHKIEESIESHGGKVIEKMPNANRRDNVYVISDIARRTAKFLEAKKSNIPAVGYKWIEESIGKGELQDYESYQLVLPEKETKKSRIIEDDED